MSWKKIENMNDVLFFMPSYNTTAYYLNGFLNYRLWNDYRSQRRPSRVQGQGRNSHRGDNRLNNHSGKV